MSTVSSSCIFEGLAGGDPVDVCGLPIKAEACRHTMSGAADGSRAVWDHLETPGDAAFSGAAPVTPRALSPGDPGARHR
ncbi:MAG: hypothetical protein AAGI50_00445 [Pseudomonadota bacterium]